MGGGAASDIYVNDYEQMPTPDLSKLQIKFDATRLRKRDVLRYHEEVNQQDRKELDKAALEEMGFPQPEKTLAKLHTAFVEAVEDRMIKGRNYQVNDDELAQSTEELDHDKDN